MIRMDERPKRNLASQLVPYGFVAPAVLLVAGFIAYPIIQNFMNSFYRFSAIDTVHQFVGLDNFVEAFSDKIFWLSLVNNVIFAAGSVVVQVGMGLILAALIERGIGFGKKFFQTVFFLPMIMSVVAVGLLWGFIYDPLVGLLNALLKIFGLPPHGWLGDPNTAIYAILIAACWQYIGFCMIILLAGMKSIPHELYEASQIDGAGRWQNFFYITIPAIRNVITTTILVTIIGSFKVFDYIFVMTKGGPNYASEVLAHYIYLQAFTLNKMGYASTIASILFGITLVFTMFQIRSIKTHELREKRGK